METRRPTNPAAEEILGGYFPVLDHGFVALVDYMGSDEDVERAARVSYGYGTRRTSQTRGLIRYLRRHHHTTPSEMVELKFHCVMPIFVARQWIRHRTACLAEGTEVYFDLPGGVKRRGNQLYKLCIEEIWERFHPTANSTRPDKQENPYFRRDRVREMKLRQVNEDNGRIQPTRIVDVYRNGPKPVFRMVLADGKSIECTVDHRFLFAQGWRSLAEGVGLREARGRAVWEEGDHYLHVNGMVCEEPALYQDHRWLREQYRVLRRSISEIAEDCSVSDHTIRKWLAKHDLTEPGRGDFNFWRGGASTERESIGRWTTQAAPRALTGEPSTREVQPKPRVAWNRLERSRLVRIERFEFVGVKETYDLEVEGPHHNFVANGIITHNSVNELSARYSLMPLLYYRPDAEQFALQSRSNNQGREGEGAPPEVYQEALRRWEALRRDSGDAYGWMLEHDVARELARIDLPLSTYTQWYWKIDLHNLLHFLTLRVDPRAQWEIQEYGRVIAGMIKRVAPLSYEAWIDYDLAARSFTRVEREALAKLVEPTDDGVRTREGARLSKEQLAELGMSGREIAELAEKLQAPDRPDFELDLSRMRSAEDVGDEMAEAIPGTKFE
jgi:flavin-dependent thymidylate synthase